MNYIQLHNNIKFPQIGLGTFNLKANSIKSALELGYRLLDTAWQYNNESEVGKAIKESGINREDIYISTKLWTEDIRSKRVKEEFEESLRNLATDYIDLYLIHWPASGFESVWETMIKLREEGKIRAIGVSNFNEKHLLSLFKIYNDIPVINQVESHPYFSNEKIIEFCNKYNIAVQAWCPLGGSFSHLREDRLFKELSTKYNKTAAQIILKWHLQRNIMIIPRSSDKKRQKENLELFDFELEHADIEKINALDTGVRMGADPDNFCF